MMPDKKPNRFIAQPGDFVLIKPGKSAPKGKPEADEKGAPKKPKGEQDKPK